MSHLDDADAQYDLAVTYQTLGAHFDPDKAREWFTKAAMQGHADAQDSLGWMYENVDDEKAVQWYTKAADQGHARALYALAYMYQDGKGVAKDENKAIELYTKSANQGDTDAENTLADLYHRKGDHLKELEWHTRAANHGNHDSQYELGCMYAYGIDVPKDLLLATKYLKMANDYQSIIDAWGANVREMVDMILKMDAELQTARAQIEHLKNCPHPNYDQAMHDFEVAQRNGIL